MAGTSTLNGVKVTVTLVRAVDSNINLVELIDIAENKAGGNNEFLRLEACMWRLKSVRSRRGERTMVLREKSEECDNEKRRI
jgi:hypothetical protein